MSAASFAGYIRSFQPYFPVGGECTTLTEMMQGIAGAVTNPFDDAFSVHSSCDV